MAGLTREERAKKEAAEKERLTKEIEEKLRLEFSQATKEDKKLKEENDLLKTQLSEMMKMIESMKEERQSATSYSQNTNTVKNVDMNARILVTSMTTGGVNMKTATDGSAKYFRLEKLGQTIPIIYEHLINCINTDRWLFEDGLVYINNADVIREQCLEECYEKFITPDKIEHILDFDIQTIQSMIRGTTKTIQESIVSLVSQKMNSGGYIDMNKIDAIGNACDEPVDIRTLANKLR